MGKVKEDFDDAGALKLKPENAKTKITRERLAKKKKRFVERGEKLGRAKILTHEEHGGIEMKEKNIPTTSITQADIREAVDVVSATKSFELTLDKFGPYRINYTRNGRYILLGGKRGHIAAFDWMTKELKHETNVMETVRDVQWLHVNTMYAVAQKRWLRIYDHNGTELHCMKQLYDVVRLDFLPHHLLLVASSNNSFLHYLDISTGNIVSSFPTKHGKLDVLSHNPTNAIVLTGSAKGVVSMWSPNSKQPLVELFAHKAPVRGIAVDESGTYMATTGLDRRLRIWDIRNYKQLHAYSMASCFGEVAFSQRRHVAAATGRIVQVFKDAHLGQSRTPYMQHLCPSVVSDLQFCPYEDVLGVAYQNGFSSLLIPGSGDPNFDALKENPFESKKQRQEREIKMLLEKIQPELITLDPADINKVNRANVERTLEYKTSVLRIKPDDIKRD